jgi:phosphoribosyl 1,2-cyclic phosphate phosphodiesterase
MRLTFLGTGGSEGYPAAFCDCPRCARARALGGPNLRRRSSLLVDDALLIDLGPDVVAALQATSRSLARLSTVLITHLHDDHFLPITLKYRRRNYVAGDLPTLAVLGSPPSLARLQTVPFSFEELRLEPGVANPGIWLERPPYRILPLWANHNANEGLEPLVYVIEDRASALLYATDTGPFRAPTWEALSGLRLDAVVLDAAFWSDADADDHLTIDGVLDHVRRLRALGVLASNGRAFATHLSHRSQPDHATVAARLAVGDVEVAYDGLALEL